MTEWQKRVDRAVTRVRADDLYNGRAFDIAKKVARQTGENFYVLSAGLGLLSSDAQIPSYSLSVSLGNLDCILNRAPDRAHFSAQQWWQAVHSAQGRCNPIDSLLRRRPNALIVIAATRPYLDMISGEVAGLQDDLRTRLRLVGPKSVASLPPQLRSLVMPYDARLNDENLTLRGTEFDYPARALAHFVDLVRRDKRIESIQHHADRVQSSLLLRCAPQRVVRRRIDDESLRQAIQIFRRDGLSRSRALEALRNTMGLACEQQRFSNAWTIE
ncbi:DUF6884 domain-containing protein [Burkholderia sp. GbtcB21]|uniref:DUF6884 domain-containing protein n=1 Tax=Burkholderia sp. GbtcB21 TaxID=2824766 RepID=UPI001C30817A|nr:DUF6884 domain-containing protein [Burkholderia sp. GbtcB21]